MVCLLVAALLSDVITVSPGIPFFQSHLMAQFWVARQDRKVCLVLLN